MLGHIVLVLTFFFSPFLLHADQEANKAPGILVEKSEADQEHVDRKALLNELEKMFQDPEFVKYLEQQKSKELGFSNSQLTKETTESFKPVDRKPSSGKSDKHVVPGFDFYEDYIKVFYPRAYVIRMNVFSFMGPKDLAKALAQLVDVFAFEPWFYFTDSPKKFKIGLYWEYVIDQLRIISDYFKKARIDLETKEIFLPSNVPGYYSVFGRARRRRTRNLFLYLKRYHRQEVSDFYALSFDYIIKLFNEGILLKNLKVANKYMSDLEFVMGKLRGTTYEAEYHESLKTCKELVALLKHKLGIDDMAMMEEFFGDDPEAMQMAKESYELGYMAD